MYVKYDKNQLDVSLVRSCLVRKENYEVFKVFPSASLATFAESVIPSRNMFSQWSNFPRP